MTCYLLHVLHEPDAEPYADPDVKDVVGQLPKFFCTRHAPILKLSPSESVWCIDRGVSCWKQTQQVPALAADPVAYTF